MKHLKKNENHSIFTAALLLPIIFFIAEAFAGGNDTTIGTVSEIIKQISTNGAHATHQKLMTNTRPSSSDTNVIKLNEEISPFNGNISKTSEWKLLEYKKQSNAFSIHTNGHFGYTLRLSEKLGGKPYVCNGSLHSSGKKLWRVDHQLLVSEEWSCGTRGCSYEVSFINSPIPESKYINLCKGV